jgi:hypothetical protein
MPAAVQLTSARVQYAAHVAVGGGVATLVSSAGGVVSITRNGAGDLTLTLKAPGVNFAAGHGPIVLVSAIAVAFANVVATLTSATTIAIRTFDAAGAALDNVSFAVLVLDSERLGGA